MGDTSVTQCLKDSFYSVFARTPLYNRLVNGFPINSRPVLRKPDLVDKELFSMSRSSGSVETASIEFLDADGKTLARNLFYGELWRVPTPKIQAELDRTIRDFHHRSGDFSKIKTLIFRHTHPVVSGKEINWAFSPGDRGSARGLLEALRSDPSQLMREVVVEEQVIYKNGAGLLRKKAFQLGN
jgi:hypothetical protein